MSVLPRPRIRAGPLLALAAATAFGGVGVFAKWAFAHGWDLAPLLSVRFLVAAGALAPFALLARGSWRGFAPAVALGLFGYVSMTLLYFASFRTLPVAAATFLLALSPILVASFAWFRERALPAASLAALGIGTLGVLLAFGDALSGGLSAAGLVLAAGSAVVYAGLVVAGRRLARALPATRAALGICVGACLGNALVAMPGGQLFEARTVEAWAVAYGLGVVSTALPLLLFYAALARSSATQVAVAANFEPIAALGLAFVAFGETLPPLALAGGACVLAGALVVALQAPASARETSAPEGPDAHGDLVL